MKKRFVLRTIFAVSILILIFLTGILNIGIQFTRGDWAPAENVDHLSYRASDVIRAEVLYRRVTFSYITHRLKVLEVFQGDAEVGDTLSVMQHYRQLSMCVAYRPYFPPRHYQRGDELVLFLRNYREHGFGNRSTMLMCPGGSVFRVGLPNTYSIFAEGIVAAYNANPELTDFVLECVGEWSCVELTIGDLILIRYEAGLGPRPYNLQPPKDVDRTRMNETIDM